MEIETTVNGRYQLREKLGEGGMGSIFLAADQLHGGREVVIKIIRVDRQDAQTEEIISCFKQEYEVMCRLHHPNLAAVIDFGTDLLSGQYFLVMEYIKGQTLKDYLLSNSPRDLTSSLDIFVQILRGLEFIHARQLIYRDLKPENIMLTGSDLKSVKLLDFGLTDYRKAAREGIRGTVQYIAPEIFRSELDFRSDLFSAGVLFYELVGKSSFYRESQLNSVISALSSEASFKRNINLDKLSDARDRQLVENLTAFQPALRPPSAAATIEKINKLYDLNHPVETAETAAAYLSKTLYLDKNGELTALINFIESNQMTMPDPLMILSGEIGNGKKRLTAELKKYCRIQDYPVFTQEAQPDTPFGLFKLVLAEMVLQAKDSLLERFGSYLKAVLPPIRELDRYQPLELTDAAALKQMNIHQLGSFIIEFSQSAVKDTVLILANLEKADDLSRELLSSLRQREILSTASRLKIIVTFTPDTGFGKAEDALRIVTGFSELQIFPVKPFNPELYQLYFETLFGIHKLHDSMLDLSKRIYEHIGGNPLFTREILHQLLQNGNVSKIQGLWQHQGAEIETISGSLLTYFQKRLDNLHFSPDEWKLFILFMLYGKAINARNFCTLFPNYTEEFFQTVFDRLIELELVSQNDTGYKAVNELVFQAVINILPATTIENQRRKFISILENRCGLPQVSYNQLSDEQLFTLSRQYQKCDFEISSQLKKSVAAVLFHAGERYASLYANRLALDSFILLVKLMPAQKSTELPVSRYKVHLKIAKVYILTGEYDAAYDYSCRALKIAENEGRKSAIADSYNSIGWCLHLKNRFEEALQYFKDAAVLAKEVNDEEDLSISLGNIGNYYIAKSNLPKALDYFKQKFTLSKKSGNRKALSSVAGNIAIIYTRLADYKTAEKFLKYKLKLDIADNSLQGLSVVYSNLSTIALEQNQVKKAMNYTRMNMDICHKIGSRRGLSVALSNMANIYITEYQMSKAREMLLEKLKIDQELGNLRGQGIVYSSLGVVYKNTGEYEIALDYLNKNLKISSQINNRLGASIAYCNMADIYKNTGKFPEAEKYYDLAIAIAEEMKSIYYLANYLSNKVKLLLDSGRGFEADLYIEKVLQLQETVQSSDAILVAKIIKEFRSLQTAENRKQADTSLNNLTQLIEQVPTKVEKMHIRYDLFKIILGVKHPPVAYNLKQTALQLYKETKLLSRQFTIESANIILSFLRDYLKK